MYKNLWCIVFFLFSSPAWAGEGITVTDAWAKPTLIGAQAGAIYLTVTNNSNRADALIAVAVEEKVADVAQLHRMSIERGIMRMRHLERLEIPAGGKIHLEPGGNHIMLMGLNTRLKPGQVFPLVLVFEQAGRKEVKVVVGD